MKRFIYFVSNTIIFVSTLGMLVRYFIMLRKYEKVQLNKKNQLFTRNRETKYMRSYQSNINSDGFHGLPISDWKDYEEHIRQIAKGKQNVLTRDKVRVLEPTSGTTSHTKYIPYTRELQREFNRALQPWLAGLYLGWPGLLGCTQYWSISPVGQEKTKKETAIPIGFEVDSQYLGDHRGKILDRILAVPPWVRNITDQESWSYVTLCYLVSDKNLGLISVWHPSFLVILLEKLKAVYPKLLPDIESGRISIKSQTISSPIVQTSSKADYKNTSYITVKPMPNRAHELSKLNASDENFYRKLWPRLKVISCWADDDKDYSLAELRKLFPHVYFQPKGIIATEGIVSFPFRKSEGLPAYQSHVLEFIDVRNDELLPLDKLQLLHHYEPVISTAGGLYRYRMNDLVTVTDFYNNHLPKLKFLCKRDYVSDIRGEKVHLHHVLDIYTYAKNRWPEICFFMIAPVTNGSRAFYTCFIYMLDVAQFDDMELIQLIEKELSKNFHYKYARQIGQLEQPAIFLLENDPIEEVVKYLESTGINRGDIKLTPLSRITGWEKILSGRFLES